MPADVAPVERCCLYARFSTEKQSDASIEDQFRVDERVALHEGFAIVARYSDEAMSAGTASRPGYQAMLTCARAGLFKIIVTEDVTRLWRNRAEFGPRSAELEDLGVHLVTAVGDDTRRDGWGLTLQLKQMIGEAARREASYRTRRGLEGRARAQKSTGGRAFGYLTGEERAIDAAQAAIVRDIFERFAHGETMLSIVSQLNGRGIPSPGAHWRRTERTTDGRWRISALHAMLRNELYVGRVVWNRARWVRSASDSKKRRYIENPREEWIVHERGDLAIVDEATWERVQRRMDARAELFPGRGAPSRYLLSGLLRCAVCSGAFVVGAHRPVRYACSTRRTAGKDACSNHIMVRQDIAEEKILKTVREELLAPEVIEHCVRYMRELAKAEALGPAPDLERIEEQIAKLKRLRDEGTFDGEFIGAALERAYRERERLRRVAVPDDTEQEFRETVAELTEAITGENVPVARAALREILEPIRLYPVDGYLEAELKSGRIPLLVNRVGSGGQIWTRLAA